MEERISGAEDSIENIGRTIKENTKRKRKPGLGGVGVLGSDDGEWS